MATRTALNSSVYPEHHLRYEESFSSSHSKEVEELCNSEDVPVRPTAEELIMQCKEVFVPSDASLEHALALVNTHGGASRPCCINIEAGEHYSESTLEIKVSNVTIKGLTVTDKVTNHVTHATIHGVWRLCQGSGLLLSFSSPYVRTFSLLNSHVY